MKILHVINNLGSGGAEKLLEDLIPLMNQVEEINVDVVLLTDKHSVFKESLVKKGVKLNVIKYKNIYDPRNIFEIKKIINKGGYDIVHSHTFPTQYWVALSSLLLKNKKVKFVTTEHSTHNRRRDKIYFRLIDRFIYLRYNTIISITEKVRDKLINWIDPNQRSLNKHVIIENGVDLEKINRALPYAKSSLISGIDENVQLVCMVGRFYEAKDQPTLIKAMRKLSENIHLVLVGEGPLIEDNKRLVNQLGLSDRVHFLGFRSDIPRILKTVDIVVLSSHWEGLSLASIEGLASDKPFIASRVNGLEEVVSGHGLIFDEGNVDELVSLIDQLFYDQKFYQETSYNCVERSKQYAIQNTAAKILTVYQKR